MILTFHAHPLAGGQRLSDIDSLSYNLYCINYRYPNMVP